MTDKKFTAADVVVGATITVRHTSRGDHVETVRTFDPLTVGRISGAYAFDKDDEHGVQFRPATSISSTTVEILDVQPPKPEYVVGGIYRVTDAAGIITLRKRTPRGWSDHAHTFTSGDGYGFWHDDEVGAWTIGDRVLVIDYPSDETAKYVLRNASVWAQGCSPDLIARALKAEAR